MMPSHWLADRTKQIELSGIRKVFELGKTLINPINLSIGQPDFDVPASVKAAAKDAIDAGHNGYTVTMGITELRSRLQQDVATRFPNRDRGVIVTSGTSGGLLVALMASVNPGDEVITPDPYFVAYPHAITLAGGKMVTIDTSPSFRIEPEKIAAAITPKTKLILISTPSNPTGTIVEPEALREIAAIARKHNILLISDEIYRGFHFDTPASSPAFFDDNVLVLEGFGKTYGMTGWRLGWAHGPAPLIAEMAKLQQFTFVCAPSIVQYAGVAALDVDMSEVVASYKRKRDLLVSGLRDLYEFAIPGGAFYLFPKAPWGSASEFIAEAVRNNMLIIPGNVFSKHDTHFRISYAASDETLHRGIDVLRKLAKR